MIAGEEEEADFEEEEEEDSEDGVVDPLIKEETIKITEEMYIIELLIYYSSLDKRNFIRKIPSINPIGNLEIKMT